MDERDTSILSFDSLEPNHSGSAIKVLTSLFLTLLLLACPCCERKKTIEAPVETKTNSPPVITSLSILPERPNCESDLSLIIQSHDPDGDLVNYRYQWIRNEAEMAGENRSVLKAGNFKKGDVIQVRVVPSDGKVDGQAFLSPPVKILNAAPVVNEVSIEPQSPTVQDNLRAQQRSTDPDGDTIFLSYQWEKNGSPMVDERKDTLERGKFKKGDLITVTVVPDDQEIMGAPKRSEAVKILNSPPTIVSSPPSSIEGTRYIYHVRAVDPDHDPVTFALRAGPKNMRIDPKSGLIQWQISKDDKGTHSIEIEVSDNEGAKSYQQYTLTVEVTER